jgi:DNA-binding response OmpR family regulator
MIIDDLLSNLELYCEALGDRFHVYPFTEPLLAIEQAEVIKPDLILLDCVMPKLHGHVVLEKIKTIYPKLPVIMISGFRIEDNLIKAMDLLVEDFIFKPVMMDELVARIENKINKSKHVFEDSQDDKIFTSNINFNDEEFEVTFEGEKFKLKNKEYKLLKYLVAKKDQLVSREEIFTSIWEDICVSPATLDTHICQLRKKLENHGDKIVTRKNTGFLYSDSIQ